MTANVDFLRQVLEHTSTATDLITNSRADFMPTSLNFFTIHQFVYEAYAATAIVDHIINEFGYTMDTYEQMCRFGESYNNASHAASNMAECATAASRLDDADVDQPTMSEIDELSQKCAAAAQQCLEVATIMAMDFGDRVAPAAKEFWAKTSTTPFVADGVSLLRKVQEHSSMAAEAAKGVVPPVNWSSYAYEVTVTHFTKVVELAAIIIERAEDALNRAEPKNPLQKTVANVVKKFRSAAGAAKRAEDYIDIYMYLVRPAVDDDQDVPMGPSYSEAAMGLVGFAQLRLSEAMTSLDDVVDQLSAP